MPTDESIFTLSDDGPDVGQVKDKKSSLKDSSGVNTSKNMTDVIRESRPVTKIKSTNRSASAPSRKEEKAQPSQDLTHEMKTGIMKFLAPKRLASSSPEKEDINFKEKQAKLQN